MLSFYFSCQCRLCVSIDTPPNFRSSSFSPTVAFSPLVKLSMRHSLKTGRQRPLRDVSGFNDHPSRLCCFIFSHTFGRGSTLFLPSPGFESFWTCLSPIRAWTATSAASPPVLSRPRPKDPCNRSGSSCVQTKKEFAGFYCGRGGQRATLPIPFPARSETYCARADCRAWRIGFCRRFIEFVIFFTESYRGTIDLEILISSVSFREVCRFTFYDLPRPFPL